MHRRLILNVSLFGRSRGRIEENTELAIPMRNICCHLTRCPWQLRRERTAGIEANDACAPGLAYPVHLCGCLLFVVRL